MPNYKAPVNKINTKVSDDNLEVFCVDCEEYISV